MKKCLILLSLLLTASFVANGQPANQIKYTEYDLENGLHVILHQDHSTPNVMVRITYHVGSKNENPDKTGFAHLFEHLMFEGTKHIERGEYFKLIQSNGGELNAGTTQDYTTYHEIMPANQLELALWMESERMLHAKIDTIGVNTQKGVVIEERKQTVETQPYGSFKQEIGTRLFSVHPYRWQTIGSADHIRNSSFDDIYSFYKTYYVPNNAVLVIAGDFEEAKAKEMVKKYFADIPKGSRPIVRPTVVEPPLKAEVRDVIYDNIQLPAVIMGYRAPAEGSKDATSMDIIYSILTKGASSRFKTNISDKGIALQTMVVPFKQEQPGVAYVFAFANVGKTLDELEAAINTEMDRLCSELVSEEEFQMAMAAKEFEVANSLTSLSEKSNTLALNYLYHKDASRINRQLEDFARVTREDLKMAACKYLNKNNRVVLHYLPKSEKK